MENKTPCTCPLAGYCDKHHMNKNPHFHHLCQTNEKYFNMWERCVGPGQEFIDCAGNSKPPEKMGLPEKKKCWGCANKEPVSQDQLKENLPSLLEQAKSFANSTAKDIANGFKRSDEKTVEERLSICNSCEFFIKDAKRCGKCGCFVEVKARRPKDSCPIGKW